MTVQLALRKHDTRIATRAIQMVDELDLQSLRTGGGRVVLLVQRHGRRRSS